MPMMNETAHRVNCYEETHHAFTKTAADQGEQEGDSAAFICHDGVVCTHHLACVSSAVSWCESTRNLAWFSISVDLLSDRSFGPEPTPPIFLL